MLVFKVWVNINATLILKCSLASRCNNFMACIFFSTNNIKCYHIFCTFFMQQGYLFICIFIFQKISMAAVDRTSNAPRHHTHCTTWGPHQVLHYNTSGTAFDHIFMYMIQYQHLRSTASTCTCYLIRICLHLLPNFPQGQLNLIVWMTIPEMCCTKPLWMKKMT